MPQNHHPSLTIPPRLGLLWTVAGVGLPAPDGPNRLRRQIIPASSEALGMPMPVSSLKWEIQPLKICSLALKAG